MQTFRKKRSKIVSGFRRKKQALFYPLYRPLRVRIQSDSVGTFILKISVQKLILEFLIQLFNTKIILERLNEISSTKY